MHRRQFLKVAAAGASSVLAAYRSAQAQMPGMPGQGMGGMMGRPAAPGSAWPTGLALRRLGTLPNMSAVAGEFRATLVASAHRVALVPGTTTQLWGYNDQSPGPVIELREGQRVAIDFVNRLGLASTIHWHGLAVPADQDGSPMDPVEPQTGRTYAFEVPVGSAGTYWYHPHAHQTTTLQVGHGLAAPLIVRSANDPLRALPELTLMVTALALDRNGQVAAGAASMGSMGGTGGTGGMGGMGGMRGMGGMGGMGGAMMSGAGELLVNGQRQPVHTMMPGATERWRIINATADRYLRLAFDGHRFTVVGTDGGLLAAPLTDVTEWLLAPAQRIEIVVAIAARKSARYALRDLGNFGAMGGGAGGELLAIQTTSADAQSPVELPGTLRPIGDLGAATVGQRIVLTSGGMGMMGPFLINGALFDMDRVDLTTVVGRVELWDLVNATFMDHPIHIHGTQFQVVSRTIGGRAVPVDYAAWLDTVNVPAGETVTIKMRQDSPGKRMVHCHILPHEDAGMMAVLDVRPS